jgi:hypothetical protein
MGRSVVRPVPDGVNEVVHKPARGAAERGTVAAVGRGARWVVAAGALALAGGGAGCVGSSKFANQPRPAVPITVSAAIDKGHIRVSPTHFGAGPITLIVSNQSGIAQDITFETDEVGGTSGGIRTSAGPVNDQDTATLQANPRPGTYRLSVKSRAIKPAAIRVGKARPSAQDQLLQP